MQIKKTFLLMNICLIFSGLVVASEERRKTSPGMSTSDKILAAGVIALHVGLNASAGYREKDKTEGLLDAHKTGDIVGVASQAIGKGIRGVVDQFRGGAGTTEAAISAEPYVGIPLPVGFGLDELSNDSKINNSASNEVLVSSPSIESHSYGPILAGNDKY